MQKTAQGAGKSSPQQTADDFGYAKNRTFVVTKAMNLVSRLDTEHIRNCLDILFNADLALKTSAINYRTVLEETIVKLSPEKKGGRTIDKVRRAVIVEGKYDKIKSSPPARYRYNNHRRFRNIQG